MRLRLRLRQELMLQLMLMLMLWRLLLPLSKLGSQCIYIFSVFVCFLVGQISLVRKATGS